MEDPLFPIPPNQNARHNASELRLSKDGSEDLLTPDQLKLFMTHLRTVRFVAHKMRERFPQHFELQELISAGMIGVLSPCINFDSKRGVHFRTYAQIGIRGYPRQPSQRRLGLARFAEAES
jgi:RNA polymerase sigma factor FliA